MRPIFTVEGTNAGIVSIPKSAKGGNTPYMGIGLTMHKSEQMEPRYYIGWKPNETGRVFLTYGEALAHSGSMHRVLVTSDPVRAANAAKGHAPKSGTLDMNKAERDRRNKEWRRRNESRLRDVRRNHGHG